MSSNIVLSAGIRQNLLSLQQTAALQQTTQERLATGKKVNSALDNAVDYFTAAALSARSTELSSLLDSMTNGVNTINAANNGLTSITATIQAMQATVTQARQDASWESNSYTLNTTAIGTTTMKSIGFSGGAVGSTVVAVDLNDTETISGASGFTAGASSNAVGSAGTLTIQANDINSGTAVSLTVNSGDTVSTVAANINAAVGYTLATTSGGQLKLQDASGSKVTIGGTQSVLSGTGITTNASVTSTAVAGPPETVDQLVLSINSNPSLSGLIKASDNAGQLQITNLSIDVLTVTGISNTSVDGTGSTATTAGNAVRANLVNQFNIDKDQLDKTAEDSSFNGVNLLNGDILKLFFNETSTSTLSIQTTNPNGVNSTTLGIQDATDAEFQNNTALDNRLQELQTALGDVASQASDLGSNLAIVQNRQDFTSNMINTLQTGSEDLTIADTNEEGANMLALQTRQQLSITALSLASQAQQSVLKLFS